jgi:hypothetical protein
MASDYITLDDLKTNMADSGLDGVADYDVVMDALITRASRMIDRLTGREPGAFAVTADTTRYFTPTCPTEVWIGELAAAPTTVSMSQTGSLTDHTDLASTDYILWPYNAALEGRPYRRIDLDTLNGDYGVYYQFPKSIKVVGKFGYAESAPEEVVQATLVQAMRWFKRAQQGFADTGAIIELAQLRYVDKLDRDIVAILYDAGLKRTVI